MRIGPIYPADLFPFMGENFGWVWSYGTELIDSEHNLYMGFLRQCDLQNIYKFQWGHI